MEDKMFELMTKMYSEFSEFKKDMTEFRKETKNDIIRLENKLDNSSKSLHDGYGTMMKQSSTISMQGCMPPRLLDLCRRIQFEAIVKKVIIDCAAKSRKPTFPCKL